MKKLLVVGVLATALIFAVSASAALVPGVFDPGNTGCVKASIVKTKKTRTLHLEKNCPTSTNAAAGADITGRRARSSP